MLLLILLLVVILFGGGYYGHGVGWYSNGAPYAWGGTSLFGILILVLVVLLLTGRL